MCIFPKYVKGNYVPCRKCIECRMQYSKEWAVRCVLEASQYTDNCMITLTYNEDNLPKGKTLVLKDFQNFIKRLRKHIEPNKLRYFGCGEYGSKFDRPHYHILIFGYKPNDLKYFCTDNKKTKLYRSSTIEKLWTKGFSSIGEVNFDSALYTAIYLQPKQDDFNGRLKPFVRMSTKPGIGIEALKFSHLQSDKIYYEGKYIKLPKYYLDYTKKNGFDEVVEAVKLKRQKNMSLYQQNNAFELNNSELVYEKKTIIDKDGVIEEKIVNSNINMMSYKKLKKFKKIFGQGIDRHNVL